VRCLGQPLVRHADDLDFAAVYEVALRIAAQQLGQPGLQAGRTLELLQQGAHGLLLQGLRHRETGVARILQEAGHVGAEPGFIGVGCTPHAEAAAQLLHAREAAESHLQALGAFLARQRLHAVGERSGFVDEHQRVGAAGGLFQAAVRVHQQALNGVAHVDRRFVGQAQADAGRPGPKRISRSAVELEAALRLDAHAAHLAHAGRDRLHLQRCLANQLDLAGADGQLDGRQAKSIGRLGGVVQDAALLVGQRDGWVLASDAQWRGGLYLHADDLRRAGQVGHIQRNRGAVAGGNEARHRQFGHKRRRHHHLGIGTGKTVGRAGHRHQAQRAVEVGQRQLDGRLAFGVERHRPAEQVDQAHLARHALGVAPRCVAAEALFGHGAVHRFDQLAVQVQQVGAVAVLAEEEVLRVRRGVACDVENAHVDSRQRDHRRAPGDRFAGSVGQRDLHWHALLGNRLGGRADCQLELALLACQRQMHEPQRARRCHAVALAAGAKRDHGDVQVVPVPGRIDRDLDLRATGAHPDALLVQHAVALDRHQRFAVVRRSEGQAGFVAGLERRAFELDRHAVGPVADVIGVLRAPAGVEPIARGLAGFHVEKLQPVAAVGHRHRNFCARRERHAARLDQFFVDVEAAGPAAVVVIAPVPAPVLAHQLDLHFTARDELAFGVDARQLEFSQAAFLCDIAVEQRTQADQHRCRPPGTLDRAHDRSTA